MPPLLPIKKLCWNFLRPHFLFNTEILGNKCGHYKEGPLFMKKKVVLKMFGSPLQKYNLKNSIYIVEYISYARYPEVYCQQLHYWIPILVSKTLYFVNVHVRKLQSIYRWLIKMLLDVHVIKLVFLHRLNKILLDVHLTKLQFVYIG